MAGLECPAAVVAGKLMEEDDGGAGTGLIVEELHSVVLSKWHGFSLEVS
jgi:hypothetical protein